jgi:c-di-GMP-related signal transduction protein
VVLGRLRISRIVQIMLFAQHRDRDPDSDPLVQMAAVRGRLMEEIATSLGLAQVRDRAFMVGILSVADALFSQPMIEILAILNLESPLQEALLHRRGTLGTLLTLVEAIETENTAIFTATARQLGLTNMDAFNRWHVAALTWAASL